MFKILQKSLILLLVAIFSIGNQAMFVVAAAADLPENLHNTNMSASTVGNDMTVDAMSAANTYGDWDDFSIGTGHAVTFDQQNAQSISLNRVVGVNPSEIFGTLTANGQIFLINPNGVLFGQNATLDVGGLVAATLNISNTDFIRTTQERHHKGCEAIFKKMAGWHKLME